MSAYYNIIVAVCSYCTPFSVRTLIRQGDDAYPVTAHSWPLFLYASNRCFVDDIEKGLFKSGLLVKVCSSFVLNLLSLTCGQAFKFIFTSPTSAIEVPINTSTNGAPPPKRSKKSAGATRSHVASLIGMRRVTPRSIAYVALQVCSASVWAFEAADTCQLRFALSSATAWNSMDGLFNYQEFYYACVDYFELVPGPVAQARVTHLLEWWNRQVSCRFFALPALTSGLLQENLRALCRNPSDRRPAPRRIFGFRVGCPAKGP